MSSLKSIKFFTVFLSGILFSIGLGVSGMMNPYKVRNFLDLFGNWDPSLIFVMLGALIISTLAFRLQSRMPQKKPLCEDEFCMPTATVIDWRLTGGAALFGVGWALSGVCPGPAIANIGTMNSFMLLFIGAMVLGIFLVRFFTKG